ncbi:DEAD/DEAH box helicase domain protein [Nitzschia inconspicua]|uniref:ATP-dependent RNA helicase n=1 Tax=Nitzschia inconspicua TaxID=303405 RepID=A0A9K3LGS1_9STRA|nr:DEAD/DEAH box helicase domain protein [Nitzschia inconspicua]
MPINKIQWLSLLCLLNWGWYQQSLSPSSTLTSNAFVVAPPVVNLRFPPINLLSTQHHHQPFIRQLYTISGQKRSPHQQYFTSSVRMCQSNPQSEGSSSSSSSDVKALGLNELQTLLREAVESQDFVEAGILSDELFDRLYGSSNKDNNNNIMSNEEKKLKRKRMSWRGLGAAPWLVDRLDALNYSFPTTIQINTMESVNQILNSTDEMVESTSLDERLRMSDEDSSSSNKDLGIVVSGSTGSGKTLAYLVPLLSTLSDSLFARQRIRVGAEESVGDFSGDLVERISVVTSPVVQTNTKKPMRAGGAIATGAALSTLGKSGKDVKSPLALIVVPTRELGIQTAMLLYELVGGSIKKDPTDIRGKANMFKYKGPKGVRVGCILDDEEAKFGLKLQTDVAITMPEYVGKVISDGDLIPAKLRVVVFDEADLALEQTSPDTLTAIFDTNSTLREGDYVPYERENPRLSFMVGASVTEALGNLVVKSRILPEGKSYIATATGYSPIVTETDANINMPVGVEPKTASLRDLGVCLDPGLKHQRVLVGNETSGLLVLTRLLRKELQKYDQNPREDAERPRVVVFFPDEAVAKESISPLRDALWGEHKLCVLLPKTGVNPLEMMAQFKNNQTTVMLATPNSVRGLDFPSVTHVYTLYLPTEDPREYVHLAGRVGRVGQRGSVRGSGGRVVSILKEEDADKMETLSRELGFEFTEVEPITMDSDISTIVSKLAVISDDDDTDDDYSDSVISESPSELSDPEDLEKLRRYLEDAVSLLSTDGNYDFPEQKKDGDLEISSELEDEGFQ